MNNKTTPFFSIIIPVFNEKNYLSECIDSILDQLFSDYELFLVDDGSNDGSETICDEYAAKDKRIKVIHQDNSGPSVGRNKGLDLASGKYVWFIDCDDFIEKDALTMLYVCIGGEQPDIVFFNGFITDGNKNGRVMFPDLKDNEWIDAKDCMLHLFEPYKMTLWNKLYNREKIGSLRFQSSLHLGEDWLFNYKMYLKSQSVLCLPFKAYHYRINHSGLSSGNYISPYKFDVAESMRLIYEDSLNQDVSKELRSYFFKTLLNVMTGLLFRCLLKPDEEDKEKIILYLDFLKHNALMVNEIADKMDEAQCKIIKAFILDYCDAKDSCRNIYDSFIKELSEQCKLFTIGNIYLYGIGNFSFEIAKIMTKNSISFNKFVKSDEGVIPIKLEQKDYNAIPLSSLSDKEIKQSLFIICANSTNTKQIEKNLFVHGAEISNIFEANKLCIHI